MENSNSRVQKHAKHISNLKQALMDSNSLNSMPTRSTTTRSRSPTTRSAGTGLFSPPPSQDVDPTTLLISPPPEDTLRNGSTSANSKRKRSAAPTMPHTTPGAPDITPNPKPRKQQQLDRTIPQTPTRPRPKSRTSHSPSKPTPIASNPNADFLPLPRPSSASRRKSTRSATPVIPLYEPPQEQFTPPREVLWSPPAPVSKSSKRKSTVPRFITPDPSTATAFRAKFTPKGKILRVITGIKSEPPDIDWLARELDPPSPSEDPLLLKGAVRRRKSTRRRASGSGRSQSSPVRVRIEEQAEEDVTMHDSPKTPTRSVPTPVFTRPPPSPTPARSTKYSDLPTSSPPDESVTMPVHVHDDTTWGEQSTDSMDLDDDGPAMFDFGFGADADDDDEWSDEHTQRVLGKEGVVEEEGEGEYTGHWMTMHVPTKQDPPTSGTRGRMDRWGRPVSPFPGGRGWGEPVSPLVERRHKASTREDADTEEDVEEDASFEEQHASSDEQRASEYDERIRDPIPESLVALGEEDTSIQEQASPQEHVDEEPMKIVLETSFDDSEQASFERHSNEEPVPEETDQPLPEPSFDESVSFEEQISIESSQDQSGSNEGSFLSLPPAQESYLPPALEIAPSPSIPAPFDFPPEDSHFPPKACSSSPHTAPTRGEEVLGHSAEVVLQCLEVQVVQSEVVHPEELIVQPDEVIRSGELISQFEEEPHDEDDQDEIETVDRELSREPEEEEDLQPHPETTPDVLNPNPGRAHSPFKISEVHTPYLPQTNAPDITYIDIDIDETPTRPMESSHHAQAVYELPSHHLSPRALFTTPVNYPRSTRVDEDENMLDVEEVEEDSSDDDEDIDDPDTVKITSGDPRAAARAAAILKQYDYDCFTKISGKKYNHRRKSHSAVESLTRNARRRSVTGSGIIKSADTWKRRSTLGGVVGNKVFIPGSPVTTLPELLKEAEVEVVQLKTPSRSAIGDASRTPLRVRYPSPIAKVQSEHPSSPRVEGVWCRDDWKHLDACFTDERLEVGARLGDNGLADVDEVSLEDVVDRFMDFVGPTMWTRESLLTRARALQNKQRSGHVAAPTILTPLSVAKRLPSMEVPDFTPLGRRAFPPRRRPVLPPPVTDGPFKDLLRPERPKIPASLLAPRYSHLLDEAISVSQNQALYSPTPITLSLEQEIKDTADTITTPIPETPPPTSAQPASSIGKRMRGFLFSYLPILSKAPKQTNKSQIPRPGLPLPPREILEKSRGLISTPVRPPLPKPKHPKELVNLHHAPLPKPSKIPRATRPQRLVELHPPPPPTDLGEPLPIQIPRGRRSSGASVKDLVKSFEQLEDSRDQTASSLKELKRARSIGEWKKSSQGVVASRPTWKP